MPSSGRTILVLAVALAAAGLAAPADALVYFTGKIGETDTSTSVGDSFQAVLDGNDNSWGVGVGVNLGQYIAFQLEYLDLGAVPGVGSACPPGVPACGAPSFLLEADSTAVALTVLPAYPLTERLTTYLKIGYLSFDTELAGAPGQLIDEADDEDLLLGLGLRLVLPGPFGFFVEYEELGDVFDSVSIGATFGF